MPTFDELTQNLPAPLAQDLTVDLVASRDRIGRKVIVLDDDPTGTQTVHGVPVLTRWSVDLFADALRSDAPAFFVLTNTRAMPSDEARSLNQTIADQLQAASAQTGTPFTLISRSDSTLRGHFPLEPEVLVEALPQCDAWVLTPFFEEGGRITLNDTHYVRDGASWLPAAQTPFAADHAFGYRSSHLRDWVIEKTGGAITAEQTVSVSIDALRTENLDTLAHTLSEQIEKVNRTAPGHCVIILNAATTTDLQQATLALMQLEARGKHFLYRTAAGFVRSRSAITPKPPLTGAQLLDGQGRGGLVIAGSYVPKTTQQLAALAELPGLVTLELDVEDVLTQDPAPFVAELTAQADAALEADKTVLIMTSRKQQTAAGESGLNAGQRISDALIGVVQQLNTRPRWLMAKGGITSSDVATKGCAIQMAQVLGQIIPGVPVWRCGQETRFPGMAYIVFPGNVGDTGAVREAVERLSV